jgi:phage shock protein E
LIHWRRTNHSMKSICLLLLLGASTALFAESKQALSNPLIDAPGHRALVVTSLEIREARRISEDEFVRMSGEAGTVILDARSAEMFQRLHVRGAVNLSFSDFTAEALAKVIPTKNTRVLIYCNNNFLDSPPAFRVKCVTVALNLSTYANLHAYGYTQVYELGPAMDLKSTKIKLAGSEAPVQSEASIKPGA